MNNKRLAVTGNRQPTTGNEKTINHQLLIDIIGWIGSVELIAAYALISAKKLDADAPLFQWLNLTGSIFLIINTSFYGAYPSAVVNIFWLFIAGYALVKLRKGRGKGR